MQSILNTPYLSLSIWLPIIFGMLVLALGRDSNKGLVRVGSLIGSLISLAATIPLIHHFDNAAHGMQFVEKSAWIQPFNIMYSLGIDGLWIDMNEPSDFNAQGTVPDTLAVAGDAVTLTLAGIAGFVLSVGMAVDANILIFERTKEELRDGRSLKQGITAGFQRAFSAIFDSNMCTAVTSILLYNFGTGAVRGFALTLLLGVALSMFTAITRGPGSAATMRHFRPAGKPAPPSPRSTSVMPLRMR